MSKEAFAWDGPQGTAAYYAAAIKYSGSHCSVCGERVSNPSQPCPDPECDSHYCPECGYRHDMESSCGPQGTATANDFACGHGRPLDEPCVDCYAEEPRDYCEYGDCRDCDGHDGQCTCPCHAPVSAGDDQCQEKPPRAHPR